MQLDRVQVLNPRTDRYVKIDTSTGRVLGMKRSPGPYKNVEIVSGPTEISEEEEKST